MENGTESAEDSPKRKGTAQKVSPTPTAALPARLFWLGAHGNWLGTVPELARGEVPVTTT